MGLLYNRTVKLSFGKPGTLGTVIENLFIQWEILKTSVPEPNTAKISVFNLNETSRAALEEKKTAVLLEVGYDGNPERLFIGDNAKISVERLGPDIVTNIESGDGRDKFKNSKINTSFGPGVTNKQIVEKLATEMGLGIGAIKGLVSGSFQSGRTLSGSVKDSLDNITEKMNVEWSIQDGNIQILPRQVASERLAFDLTPQTGLLGSPIRREDSKKGGKYIEFRALLRTGLNPGAAVKILSRDVDGFFKIRKAFYIGDNRSGPFEVKCEAVELAAGADLPNTKLAV